MKLPHGDDAIIEQRKITEYCLSTEHDDGRHKARLFERLLGLTIKDADVLIAALREAAVSGDAIVGREDAFGRRFIVDFPFSGPRGAATIRSAWIVRTGEHAPRLVTCYIL